MEEVIFRPQEFTINAGLVGLINMLEYHDKSCFDIENKFFLKVSKQTLLNINFSDLYFKVLIQKYENICPLTKMIFQLKTIENKEFNEASKELKAIIKNLNSNRYIAGFNTIKDKVNFNFFDELKKLKNITKENYKENINTILEYLNNKEIKEIFLIKDIIYFVINHFWSDVAFLNRQYSNNNPKEEFKKNFEEPFKEYIKSSPTGDEYCALCGEPIKGNNKIKTSYVLSLTEDFARKNSNYWNFKPNCFACPKCNFLLSLMPIGFTPYGKNYLFMNINHSIKSLRDTNSDIMVTSDENYYNKYNAILNKIAEKELEQLKNVEVITKLTNLDKYNFDIISKSVLERLNKNKNNLNKLSKIGSMKYEGNYINIYDEVMECVIKNRSLYRMLHLTLLLSLESNYEFATIYSYYILKIEGGTKNMDHIIETGARYNKGLNDEKKIKELTFQMLDLIRYGNAPGLYDLIIKLANITEEVIPVELYEMINSKEKLNQYGYAFVTGFRNGERNNEK